jgi:hypothetical protein
MLASQYIKMHHTSLSHLVVPGKQLIKHNVVCRYIHVSNASPAHQSTQLAESFWLRQAAVGSCGLPPMCDRHPTGQVTNDIAHVGAVAWHCPPSSANLSPAGQTCQLLADGRLLQKSNAITSLYIRNAYSGMASTLPLGASSAEAGLFSGSTVLPTVHGHSCSKRKWTRRRSTYECRCARPCRVCLAMCLRARASCSCGISTADAIAAGLAAPDCCTAEPRLWA